MEKNSLEKMYEKMMKGSSFGNYSSKPTDERDRFKSILCPDYSDYSTSTVTGNIC